VKTNSHNALQSSKVSRDFDRMPTLCTMVIVLYRKAHCASLFALPTVRVSHGKTTPFIY